MKRLAIQTGAVLAACLCICWLAQAALGPVLDGAETLCEAAREAAEQGDAVRAEELLEQLEAHWERGSRRLEVFCDHDDLHAVREHIVQAEISLEADQEDFRIAMALAVEAVEHIRDEEALRWLNLL